MDAKVQVSLEIRNRPAAILLGRPLRHQPALNKPVHDGRHGRAIRHRTLGEIRQRSLLAIDQGAEHEELRIAHACRGEGVPRCDAQCAKHPTERIDGRGNGLSIG